ncbi:MAG TPA: TIGR03086 family metal-binding protein [Acidimicrobiia bacterium]|nr:TIGR03086 family metal-binding protein [Acidimicrobiia bacterium]
MSDPIEELRRAIDQTGRIVRAVTADQLDAPTPCAEWTVRALLQHTINVIDRVTGTITGDTAEPVDLSSDLETFVAAYDRSAGASAAAWGEPGVLDRELVGPWGPTPGERICRLNLADTVVHGWDVARATGQSTAGFDPELAEAALAFMHQMMKPEFRGGPAFGPEVPVAADAPAYDRLAGFAGRTP